MLIPGYGTDLDVQRMKAVVDANMAEHRAGQERKAEKAEAARELDALRRGIHGDPLPLPRRLRIDWGGVIKELDRMPWGAWLRIRQNAMSPKNAEQISAGWNSATKGIKLEAIAREADPRQDGEHPGWEIWVRHAVGEFRMRDVIKVRVDVPATEWEAARSFVAGVAAEFVERTTLTGFYMNASEPVAYGTVIEYADRKFRVTESWNTGLGQDSIVLREVEEIS